jgi:hypothetical protein
VGNERGFSPERETTRAVLTAVDIKIETRFLIGIWKPTPISGVMLALTMLEVGNYLKSTGLTLKPV